MIAFAPQRLGFFVTEVGENLPALLDTEEPWSGNCGLLTQKIETVDPRISELKAFKRGLMKRVAQTRPLTRLKAGSSGKYSRRKITVAAIANDADDHGILDLARDAQGDNQGAT